MKAGSTGFLKIALNIDGDFDSVIFTLKSDTATITKEYPNGVALLNDNFYVPLGQNDTTLLQGYVWVEAQINFSDGRVRKSECKRMYIGSTLATKIMETQFPDGADLDEEDIADLTLLLEDLKGNDGYSPTVTVTAITGGHRIVITDINGEHPFDVFNGSGGGEVDPQAIADAVEAYMQEHDIPTADEVEQIVADYVKANVELVGTEDELTSLEVNGVKYKMPQGGGGGTDVVANPTLDGTEPALTGLKVAGDKYKVPQIPEDITGVWTSGTTMYIAVLEDGDNEVYPND